MTDIILQGQLPRTVCAASLDKSNLSVIALYRSGHTRTRPLNRTPCYLLSLCKKSQDHPSYQSNHDYGSHNHPGPLVKDFVPNRANIRHVPPSLKPHRHYTAGGSTMPGVPC